MRISIVWTLLVLLILLIACTEVNIAIQATDTNKKVDEPKAGAIIIDEDDTEKSISAGEAEPKD